MLKDKSRGYFGGLTGGLWASMAGAAAVAWAPSAISAERRQADLQKTAVAVSVRQGSDLQQQGKFTTRQILEDIPSVVLYEQPGIGVYDSLANSIVIRGVTSNSFIQGDILSQVPSAAYYVDGVLNGIGGTYDIGSVQVLRGPQGTLYGRSATAGAMIVNTPNPTFDGFGGNASVELGNYSLQHYSGAANLPVSDVVALRVSANSYKRDGWYAPKGQAVDTDDARVKLLIKPTENLSVLLGAAMQNNLQASGEWTGRLAGAGTDDVEYDVATPLGNGSDRTRQYWAQVDWDLGAATLSYLPAFRDYKQRVQAYTALGGGTLITNTNNISKDTFQTHELRLTSKSTTPLQWQGGVFYYINELALTGEGRLYPGGGPNYNVLYKADPENRTTKNLGVYGESTYSFSDTLRLTTGLRGDYTKVTTEETQCTGDPNALTCFTLTPAVGTESWRNLTYKLRFEQDLSPSNLWYGSVASAFLPGDVGVSNPGGGNPLQAAIYDVSRLTSIEFGSKNRFLDNTLQVNGDVFYYIYGGRQQPVVTAQSGTILYTQIMQAPVRMLGVELEGVYRPTSKDTLGLNLSYTDAYYKEKSAEFAAGVANSHLYGVVPWQVTPSYSHVFTLPGAQTLTFNAQALYRSSYLGYDITPANYTAGMEQYLRTGNTVQGNLSLTYAVPKFSLTGYVRNVGDTTYKLFNGGLQAPTPFENQAQLSEPRTYGVVFNLNF
jgi:iron complex outermembrane receptor protein